MSEIKVSNITRLNDPFECQPSYKILRTDKDIKKRFYSEQGLREMWQRNPEYVAKFGTFDAFVRVMRDAKAQERIKKKLVDPNALKQGLKTTIAAINKDFYMLSLSAEENNILMWAHYSKAHTGAVIEFDVGNLMSLEILSQVSYQLHKVNYRKKRPAVNTARYQQEVSKEFKEVVKTKSKHWAYEKEWRLIISSELLQKRRELHFLRIKQSCIKRVIIGCKMIDENKRKLKELLRLSEWSHVDCSQAELDDSEYGLSYV